MRDDEDKLTNSDESFFMIMEFRDAGCVTKTVEMSCERMWRGKRENEQVMKNNFQRDTTFFVTEETHRCHCVNHVHETSWGAADKSLFNLRCEKIGDVRLTGVNQLKYFLS